MFSQWLLDIDFEINSKLKSSIKVAAGKGVHAACGTVASWASKSTRTAKERAPGQNGLKYPSYNAAVRRSGQYVSRSAGEIDMNQELCDPMEEHFSADWQRTMDSAIGELIAMSYRKISNLCNELDKSLATALAEARVDASRLRSLRSTALRSCQTMVKQTFTTMRTLAADSQRELNRTLLPKVKEGMSSSYSAALAQPRGTGVFRRMDAAMQITSEKIVLGLFNDATNALLNGVEELVKKLEGMVRALGAAIARSLESVYSILWESCPDNGEDQTVRDPAHEQLVRSCRDKLAREFATLSEMHKSAMSIMGIEREDLELEMVAVDSLDDMLAKREQLAVENGMMVNLCDSADAEVLPPMAPPMAIKEEDKRL